MEELKFALLRLALLEEAEIRVAENLDSSHNAKKIYKDEKGMDDVTLATVIAEKKRLLFIFRGDEPRMYVCIAICVNDSHIKMSHTLYKKFAEFSTCTDE